MSSLVSSFLPLDRKRFLSDLGHLHTAIYEESLVGCCLHIILDDGNYDKNSVEFCLNHAKEKGHLLCFAMAVGLSLLTEDELDWLSSNGGEYDRLDRRDGV